MVFGDFNEIYTPGRWKGNENETVIKCEYSEMAYSVVGWWIKGVIKIANSHSQIKGEPRNKSEVRQSGCE